LDDVHPALVAVLLQVEVVEVGVEALRDPPSPVEHERGDEAARAVALVLQHLRQRHLVVADVEAAVVAHAVPGRERPRQERGVRGQGERGDRGGAGEAETGAGQRVEAARLGRGIPVAAEVVRAQGVDRHQQQVAGARTAEPSAVA
jgi:hypothetical protein